uniref:ATP diphosphatase n=1 Tax=Candidatus Kentrum sp. LFY TaxID=2126342 RepID=A0A450WTG3_9GAMM|nr:MAG: ATP diphosphatase [Candidatus Kentron sp. LFY]
MADISSLLDLMERLRDPRDGCPWDRMQTFASLASYTVEEAYEVADAISRDDMADFASELGDLLFHIVFHAQIAREAGLFDFEAVVSGIVGKMTRRHPHVFAGEQAGDIAALTTAWEAQKAAERKGSETSLMDQVTKGLPAMRRAVKLQKKAAQAKLDEAGALSVMARLQEDMRELESEAGAGGERSTAGGDRDTRIRIGNLLFACVRLARHLDVDPDEALREANAGFEYRFRAVEKALLSQGKAILTASPEELDTLWKEVGSEEG